MRRALVAAAVLVGFLVTAAPSCQPSEPAMKISAKADADPLAASTSYVRGAVSPAKATAKVYLQKTSGGQWVDWKSCPAGGCVGAAKVPTASVNQSTGAYTIAYPVQWCGVKLHLRVRSAGGTAFSPGFYTEADPYEAC